MVASCFGTGYITLAASGHASFTQNYFAFADICSAYKGQCFVFIYIVIIGFGTQSQNICLP